MQSFIAEYLIPGIYSNYDPVKIQAKKPKGKEYTDNQKEANSLNFIFSYPGRTVKGCCWISQHSKIVSDATRLALKS